MVTPPTHILRQNVCGILLARIARDEQTRQDALQDVLGLTVPNIDDQAAREVARLIPPLPHTVYEKWVNLFCDKLFETTPPAQLQDICSGTEESNAVLSLVFLMFMESERMESVVADDLKTLGISLSRTDEEGTTVGLWLRSKMTSNLH